MPKRKRAPDEPGVIYSYNGGNEYRLDGKQYVRKIKKCRLNEKKDGRYLPLCRIHQRGEHFYEYAAGGDYLEKYHNGPKLWLTHESRAQVERAVAEIDAFIEELRQNGREAANEETRFRCFYRPARGGGYDAAAFFIDENGCEHVRIFEDCAVGEPLYGLRIFCTHRTSDRAFRDLVGRLWLCDKETVGQNPLFASAAACGDKVLQTRIKLCCRIAETDECSFLAGLLGLRVLPPLPEKFDQKYYVDADTLDLKLLDRSGYHIAHRPYFAMPGSTHAAWTLNPHRKSGVDAAPIGAPTIAFADFLRLFDKSET